MALNDLLKHMPAINDVYSDYKPSEEFDFINLKNNKVLSAPPFSNVSISIR